MWFCTSLDPILFIPFYPGAQSPCACACAHVYVCTCACTCVCVHMCVCVRAHMCTSCRDACGVFPCKVDFLSGLSLAFWGMWLRALEGRLGAQVPRCPMTSAAAQQGGLGSHGSQQGHCQLGKHPSRSSSPV